MYVEAQANLVVDEEKPLVQTPEKYSGYTSNSLQHSKSTFSYKEKKKLEFKATSLVGKGSITY